MTIAIIVFMVIGIFFAAIGTLGILRMPDVFGRLQASTCIATLSSICIGIAGILYVVSSGMSLTVIIKLVIFVLLILLTNPISNHALCKAAYKMGVPSGRELVVDDYGQDFGKAQDKSAVQTSKETKGGEEA